MSQEHGKQAPGAAEDVEGERSGRATAAPPCADLPLAARIEAILLTTDRPVADARLGELLGLAGKGAAAAVGQAMQELNDQYQRGGRSFRAQRVAGGWQLLTLPEYAPLLERLHHQRAEARLSQAALETLAIIAYRQPIMRAEIEAIRGVACGEVLRSLMERRLVKVTGRAEQLGRPMLYGTTGQFLKVFGLPAIDALPAVDGEGPDRARYGAAEEPSAPQREAGEADDAAAGADG